MVHKVLSLAQKLAMLPAAAMPQKIITAAGHPMWRSPKFSKRQLADLKKQAVAAGHTWPLPEKPERPAGESFHELRVFFSKGHKFERLKPARDATIAQNMLDMPAKLAEWRKARAAAKAKDNSELNKLMSSEKINY